MKNESAKRILHLVGSAQVEAMGIARTVSTLALRLDPQQYQTEVWFVGKPGPLVEFMERHRIAVRVIPWRHPRRDLFGLIGLWSRLRSSNYDLIHLHWGGRGVRRIVRNATRAMTIFHLHSSIDESSGSKIDPITQTDLDAVIAVSQEVAKNSNHPNTRVIHAGVEPDSRCQIDRNHTSITIGTAGRLVPAKGFSVLLQAMKVLAASFPQLRLEIAGEGAERRALQAEVAALGIPTAVSFLGWLPELPAKFYDWDIFVQPSLSEGFGLATLEAMASGLPVVASRVGGLQEIVLPSITGELVPAGDPQALASALHRLIEYPALAREMGDAGRMRAQQSFSAQRMADEMSEVYNKLLEKATSFSRRRERR